MILKRLTKSISISFVLLATLAAPLSAVVCYERTLCPAYTAAKSPRTGLIDGNWRCIKPTSFMGYVTKSQNPRFSPERPASYALGTINKFVPDNFFSCGYIHFKKPTAWVKYYERDLLGEGPFVVQCGNYLIQADCRTYAP